MILLHLNLIILNFKSFYLYLLYLGKEIKIMEYVHLIKMILFFNIQQFIEVTLMNNLLLHSLEYLRCLKLSYYIS